MSWQQQQMALGRQCLVQMTAVSGCFQNWLPLHLHCGFVCFPKTGNKSDWALGDLLPLFLFLFLFNTIFCWAFLYFPFFHFPSGAQSLHNLIAQFRQQTKKVYVELPLFPEKWLVWGPQRVLQLCRLPAWQLWRPFLLKYLEICLMSLKIR